MFKTGRSTHRMLTKPSLYGFFRRAIVGVCMGLLTSSYMKSGSELVASSSVLVKAWSAKE